MLLGKVRLDRGGMAAVLKSQKVRAATQAAGGAVAANLDGIESHEGPVEVVLDDYTSDRAVVGVTLAHASGVALQAKRGVLTKAAREAGLDVGKGKS